MTFVGPLKLQAGEVDAWARWTLLEPLQYESIIVPTGFETDGASIPRPLWWFLPTWGRYSRAAVVHDYLCRTKTPSRRKADAVFFDAMVECGVNVTVRWMWLSVRLYAICSRK